MCLEITARSIEEYLELADLLYREPPALRLEEADKDIGLSPRHVQKASVGDELNLDRWIGFVKLGDAPRQVHAANALHARYPHRAGRVSLFRAQNHFDNRVSIVLHPLGELKQLA